MIKERSRDSHKGTYGKALIVAGSSGMMGAAVLSSKACIRTGSGLVQLSAEKDQFHIAQIAVPEVTCIARGSEELDGYHAIGIGPGLGINFPLEDFLRKVNSPVVIDADALTIVARDKIDLKDSAVAKVLTPHPGEAARLLATTSEDINNNRKGAALEIAKMAQGICVLKGNGTVIANAFGDTVVNPTGNPGMATGGSGDVLTGIITSFLGQGYDPMEAAHVGVYVHGLAGDIAKKEKGEYGLIASDIVDSIPYAIKQVQALKEKK